MTDLVTRPLLGSLLFLITPLALNAQYFAYVANAGDNTVSVIQTPSNTVVAIVPVGNYPLGLAATPDGAHVYVANGGDNTVSVIDTSMNLVILPPIPVGNSPVDIAVTPDGRHVYVANEADSTVSVIETDTNEVVTTVRVGGVPEGLAVSPDGTRVYVANAGEFVNTVSVISTFDYSVNTLVGFDGPDSVTITPHGSLAYVTNFFNSTVSVVAISTGTILGTIHGAFQPVSSAIMPNGAYVYVLNNFRETVSVIATATNTIVATVSLNPDSDPYSLAISPDNAYVYVTDHPNNSVEVIKTADNIVATTIPVGAGPTGIAFTPITYVLRLDPVFLIEPQVDVAVLYGGFTLGKGSNGINLPASAVSVLIGGFSVTIPSNFFQKNQKGGFSYSEAINGAKFSMSINPQSGNTYSFAAQVESAILKGLQNPVPVTLTIGNNTGSTLVKAQLQ